MLMDVLRVMINNSFREYFYEKKTINILTIFFIFYQNFVKIFLKLVVNYCPKNTH